MIFPTTELPELSRGKGNKIIGIPAAKIKSGEEVLCAITTFSLDEPLILVSGKRQLTIRGADVESYFGERGRRGGLLPKGFRNVSSIR